MTDNNLSGKVGLDTTEFKTGITELNRQVRVIESGFRAASAGLGNWGKSASGLELRIEALTKEMGIQEQKVEATRREYERIAKEKGENSRAAQELQIKLNRENETLGKMQSELRQTNEKLDEMGDESKHAAGKVDDLADKEERAEKKAINLKGALGGLKSVLGNLGKLAIGAAAGVAAIGAGIAGMVAKATDAAGELVDLSLKTGISIERLQELRYVGDQVGTDLDTMTGSLARMTRAMGDVGTSKEITAAFKKLGVNATDANGNLRDSEVVFGELLGALGKVENETERDALAMEIFGRSALELNPLIKAGADEIARLTDQAHQVGAVMDTEAVEGLEAFGDTLAGLKQGLMGIAGTLAGALLPGLQELGGGAMSGLKDLANIAKLFASGDTDTAVYFLGGFIRKIVQGITAALPGLLEAGLSILTAIINGIVQNLPTLLQAAIQMITTLVGFIIQMLPVLMQAGIDIVLALVKGIGPQLPMLVESAIQMIVTLAEGLADAIPELLPAVAEIIPQVVLALIENLPLLIDAALKLILALAEGLVVAIPMLIKSVPEIVQAIFDAIVVALPIIAEAGVRIIQAIIEGGRGKSPELTQFFDNLVKNIRKVFTETLPTLVKMGGEIISAVWQGIKEKAGEFFANVKEFFGNLIAEAKEAIGWHSPPLEFVKIGKGSAEAVGIGWLEGLKATADTIGRSMAGLVGSGQFTGPAFAGARARIAGDSGNNIVMHNTFYIDSKLDINRVASELADLMGRRR